jgi:hypothetical protein
VVVGWHKLSYLKPKPCSVACIGRPVSTWTRSVDAVLTDIDKLVKCTRRR